MLRLLVLLGGCALAVYGAAIIERSQANNEDADIDLLMDILIKRNQEIKDEEELEVLTDKLDKRINGADNSDNSAPIEPAEESNPDPYDELTEGDMMLTPEQKQALDEAAAATAAGGVQKRKFKANANIWPNKTVFYSALSGDSKWVSGIKAGMQHIEQNTCIRFQQADSGPRLNFFVGSGCTSLVGMSKKNDGQKVSIAMPCLRLGTVVHEIMHALGMFHEQSRPDRDNYITVHYDNIQAGKESNFKKYDWDKADMRNIPYDMGSLMHYGAKGFAIDRSKYTITPKDMSKLHLIGQRKGLSQADIDIISAIYECPSGGGGTGTPKPTPKPTPACADKSRKCAIYKSRGGCSSSSNLYNRMTKKCKKTCNFCGGSGLTVALPSN